MKRNFILLFIFFSFEFYVPLKGQMIVTTIAGSSSIGSSGDGAPATAALLNAPWEFAFDTLGNLYFTDFSNHSVRKIDTFGVITKFAGTGSIGFSGDGGPATAARFNNPGGIAIDAAGNMYIADDLNKRVRKIDIYGIITTIAGTGTLGYSGDGGAATLANINYVNGLTADASGNVYIADQSNRVRKIDVSGIITTIAGTGAAGYTGDGGAATNAKLNFPNHISVDNAGNVYLSEYANTIIRFISASGIISTLAGKGSPGFSGDGGPATAAAMKGPAGIDAASGDVLFCDIDNHRVRSINSAGIINTIAGSGSSGFSGDGGPALAANFNRPHGVIRDKKGDIYVADYNNHRIRKIWVNNRPPVFVGGKSRSITICQNALYDSVNKQLAITDSDNLQTETWILITSPLHGSAIVTGAMPSTGDTVTPRGFSYTPLPGYVGNDSFIVRVNDGIASDTITIYVTVTPAPVSISGINNVCAGFTTTLTDATPGGAWSSSNTTKAIVGSGSGLVTGIAGGTAIISYSLLSGCSARSTVTINPLPLPISGTSNVCTGTTATLTDAGGGTWSSSNTAVATIGISSGIVSGILAGTTTITYQFATGCAVTSIIRVIPPTAPITGVSVLCAGMTTVLSDTTAVGKWTSSNTSIATVGTSSGIVTGLLAGTTTITYTPTTTGCIGTRVVTVNPLPSPISGIMKICVGSTTLLSDAGGGKWTSSNTSVATIDSVAGIVDGITAGTSTIAYSLATGCIAMATITVNPNPAAITGITGICQGATTTLSNATGAGTWKSNVPAFAGIGLTTGIITAFSMGTSTISYTLATGCVSTIVVTVNPLPGIITGVLRVCIGSTTNLSNSAAGGNWTSGSTTIVTIDPSTGIATGIIQGTGTITYSLSTGCNASTIVTVLPLPSITGPTRLCIGTTTTLSGSSGGGVWSSGSTGIATVSSSGVVTGVSAGTSTITYRILTGCMTITTVSVASSPAPIVGIANACVGATTVLSDATPGGGWSSSNSTVASVGSGTGIVAGTAAGTATISYSLGLGCRSIQVVTVNALSPITGSSAVCTGLTALLSNSVPGGTWSSSNTLVASISGVGMVTGLVPGTSVVSYLLPTGCNTTKTIIVNALPPAITGTSYVCTAQKITLSNASTGGTWNSSNAFVASVGTASGIVTGAIAGTANITYSLGSGCATTTTVTVFSLPSPISGSPNVCEMASVTLSDATTGGTWSTLSTGIADVGSLSGIVTGVSAGTTIMTYTSVNGCAVSKVMTVDPIPAPITGNTTVCAGATTALSSTSSGGTWSPVTGALAYVGGTTGIVSGVSPGTIAVVYTLATGCSSSSTVTVFSPPVSITGPSNVCQGLSVLLSDATGGMWSSSNTSVATIDVGTGNLTGIISGIANITYSLSSGCNVTKMIIVNPVTPITGTTTLCAGATTALYNAVSGGTWSSNSTTNATIGISSGNVNGITAGTAAITYKTPLGCIATTTVVVNPLPFAGSIAVPSSVCVGSSIVLTDAISGGTWSTSATTVAIGMYNGIVTGVSAGTGSVTYSYTNSCGTAIATYSITVNPLPATAQVTGDSTVCAGSMITLSDATIGGTWSSSASAISVGSASGIVTGVSKGSGTVTYAWGNMCGTVTALHAVTVLPLPIIGPINGISNVCVGANTMLTDSVAGGIWMCSNPRATVSGGVVTGVSAGKDTVIYITANTCGTKATIHYMTIDPLPDAGVIAIFSAVCVGATDDTLWDAVPGGTWSSSDATILLDPVTGVVTGLSPGVATVTYHVVNVCGPAIATKSIDVHPQPFAGLITGPASVCAGTSIVLSDTVIGGAWSTANTLLEVSLDGTVTGVTAGLGTIKYSVTNICGTAVVVHDVIVNPQPYAGIIEGDSAICVGNEITVTDIASGGVWSSNSPVVSISTAGIVKGLTVGTTSITYTVTNMCGTAIAEKGIEVLSIPVVQEITGQSSLCQGMSISLSDASANGTWSSSNNMLSVSDGVVTGHNSGVDTIMYTLTNMCCATKAIKEITVNPQPYAGAISGHNRGCPGDTIILHCDGMAGTWSNSNNAVASLKQLSDSTIIITGNVSGIDTISYAVSNSCGAAIAKFLFTVLSEADCPGNKAMPFDCNGNGELMIYPNPNAGIFTINVVSDIQEDVFVVITNIIGQKLRTMKMMTNVAEELNLNQPHGVYIISVVSAHGQCSKKVTVAG